MPEDQQNQEPKTAEKSPKNDTPSRKTERKVPDEDLDDYQREKQAIMGEVAEAVEEKPVSKPVAPKKAVVVDVQPVEELAQETEAPVEPEVEAEKAEPDMVVSEETYLTAGVHIGTQQKSAHMKPFLYRVRNDGLFVLNVKLTDQRIKEAATFLSRFEAKDILVVSARQYGKRPVRKMAMALGNMVLPGRFVPGTLTNPNISQYVEPKVMLVTDPAADAQAMREAISVGIPIVGICDANNLTKYVDLVIPGNNKGRKSLALMYYLITRTILQMKGELTDVEEFSYKPEDFEESL